MKRALFLYLAFLATLVFLNTSQALAGPLDDAKFALHAQSVVAKANPCSPNDPNTVGLSCSEYTTTWATQLGADVYLVVAGVDSVGIKGLRCGIEYNPAPSSGVDVFAWSLCTDGLEFPAPGPNGDWPAPGAGNTITWITCQETVIGSDGAHAIAGAFYVYAYGDDALAITPNNVLQAGPELAVADCSGASVNLNLNTKTGEVAFGTGTGFNPCGATPPGTGTPLFDFNPGNCPNTLTLGKGGFVTAALVGQSTLGVAVYNQSTILVEGVAPTRISTKDVATPFTGTPCDCHDERGDKLVDLNMRISRSALLAAIGPVQAGDEVVLTVTGELVDGTPFTATDCAVIAAKGGGRGGPKVGIQTVSRSSDTIQRLSYSLAVDSDVRLAVFDVSGRRVANLVNDRRSVGTHFVDWNTAGQPNGMYFYRLETSTFVDTQKLLVLH